MKKQVKTTDISGKMILLGTGTSVGVPAIGCSCDVCQSGHPRNQRTRASAIIGLPEGNLLIDTSPDLRTQLLREQIGIVHFELVPHQSKGRAMEVGHKSRGIEELVMGRRPRGYMQGMPWK